MCLNADTRIDREATVLAGQHLFGITTLDQALPDKGAQDASTQVSLRMGHDGLVDSTGRVNPQGLPCWACW